MNTLVFAGCGFISTETASSFSGYNLVLIKSSLQRSGHGENYGLRLNYILECVKIRNGTSDKYFMNESVFGEYVSVKERINVSFLLKVC